MKVRIYTDGACSENPGPGGWASVWMSDNNIKVISGCNPKTTNNQMELTAVVASLRRVANILLIPPIPNVWMSMEYEIYSDSAYVVNSINNNWIERWRLNGWKTSKGDDVKNVELWMECLKLLSQIRQMGIKITFIKVKGHSGDTLNEYADEIARREVLNARKAGML